MAVEASGMRGVCSLTLQICVLLPQVRFTPTVEHCSMATLIGLCIRVKLLRALPPRFKVGACPLGAPLSRSRPRQECGRLGLAVQCGPHRGVWPLGNRPQLAPTTLLPPLPASLALLPPLLARRPTSS